MLVNSLAGLPAFAAYFLAAIIACVAFVVAYTTITPNREIELIAQGNLAAALSVGMSLIGFALPLASAIFHTANLIDCAIWALVALATQLCAYWLARLAMPGLPAGIAKGEAAAGVWVGSVSVAAGALNAACMSY